MSKFTLSDFLSRFPNEEACLNEVMHLRYGDSPLCKKCGKKSNFYRVSDRTAYACQFCGHHLYPLAGTLFDKSSTPLTSWMYAIFLIVQTEDKISARQLSKELGVTYKTAWRMSKNIRPLAVNKP